MKLLNIEKNMNEFHSEERRQNDTKRISRTSKLC